MKLHRIRDERDFYAAVADYSIKVWEWGAHVDDDFDCKPTPDEVIRLLEERIHWVREHKKSVDEYLRRRHGTSRLRVIED